ncbi:MAG: hypothetical protein B7C24_05665 [Bacteroidetes bacterium 4572_77]|nr:MAG: hypothetical protein B7C24_05665 [Bacteroidetes bacterium 4572_77]
MKIRFKPSAISSEEYLMIGISTSWDDFQLAHHLNKQFDNNFYKINDIVFYDKNGSLGNFPFYYHRDFDLKLDYYLLANRGDEHFLLPKYKNFEFFILFRVSTYSLPLKELLTKMRKLSNINAALEIPLLTVKNLSEILEDIEIHLMEINTRSRTKELKDWLW